MARINDLRPRRGGAWPVDLEDACEALFRSLLRFTRPGGSAMFEAEEASADRLAMFGRWAKGTADPGLKTILRWWSGKSRRPIDPSPPLPACGSGESPLAVLRADWSREGDWAAIDARHDPANGLFELAANGQRLMGPSWTSGSPGSNRSARSIAWKTGPMADVAEWTFATATSPRVTRTVVLLRGRKLAILADQVEGTEASMSVELAPGVAAKPIVESRALALGRSQGAMARVYPLALPCSDYPTERGALIAEGPHLVLRQKGGSRRIWMPLLVSWDARRNRKAARWRVLTVSQRSKVCPPGTAFAARIGWGPGDGLVVYRSLGRPAPRAFLGHQTGSRFLVGQFSAEGDVIPLLSLE